MPHYTEDYAENTLAPEMPDPRQLIDLATGYWGSAVFLAATRLRLFPLLSHGPLNATEVASKIGCTPRAAEIFLNALCGLDLLVDEDGRYRLTAAAAAYLVPDSSAYMGSAIDWAADQYEAWGRLPQALQAGTPIAENLEHLGKDPERTRTFVYAMHERAKSVAMQVAEHLDISSARSLLDVGGGPGTYSVMLAQLYPDLHSTVLDLAPIVAISQELIARQGLDGRVQAVAGDAVSGEYGEGHYDAVLFSGVLHQMGAETIQRMINGAHRALTPGGRVYISDVMLDVVRTQPTFATLFSVQMLLTSREGAVFSVEDCETWLESAGFTDIERQRLPEPLPYTVVTAVK
jgi:SAM-dependent methyltransferase